MRFVALLLVMVCMFVQQGRAQLRVDTVRADVEDTARGFQMKKSPLLAMGLSALLPGAGQVYLDQWWKVPIIIGAAGGTIYGALIQNYRYHYTSDSVNIQYGRRTLADSVLARRYERAREFYRDDRDKWWIYTGLVYIMNVLDAYIAAHLYDFDVSDGEPVGLLYDPTAGRVSVTYGFRF